MPGQSDRNEAGRSRRRFSRRLRLVRAAEFSRVFRDARRSGDRFLTVLAIPNSLGHPRLGLAISRKSVKSAVQRNVIKRQIRDSFRLHQDEIGSLDVVVLSRPGIGSLDRRTLRTTLDRLWQQLPRRCRKS